MKMLIENWKSAYKYLTVQLAAGLLILSEAFEYLPMLKEYVPQNYVMYVSIAIIVARIVAQPKVSANKDKEA
jgi:hypothetical protein